MHGDLAGVLLSVSLIGVCTGVSCFFRGELKRKIVHIGVSNFAFIYLYVFESDLMPVLGLCAFAVINLAVAVKQKSRRYGTVLFPISVVILITAKSLGFGTARDVACATLAMGWGDGLAALVGMCAGKTKMPLCDKKTVVGSFTVFACVMLCIVFVGGKSPLQALAVSVIAVLAEAYTPYGLDNVSVPAVVFTGCALI